MRIEIICCNDQLRSIPLNYNYYLTSAIYKSINVVDKDLAKKIHDDGFYEENEHKNIKLFTYSFLKGNIFKVKDLDLKLSNGCFKWFISSPLNRLLEIIALGFYELGYLEIKHEYFKIQEIKIRGTPKFKGKDKFICNSPIVVSKLYENGRVEYLTKIDDEFNIRVNNNLAKKYEILFGEKYTGKGVNVYASKKYTYTKLIKFKDIKLKGIFDEITLEGDTDLINIAYDSGLGEKNSMGFGMIEKKE
ncbi:MAG: CRISPR-associated endoribonuclease Cas6 [candidate division WOR-3 bacterium]